MKRPVLTAVLLLFHLLSSPQTPSKVDFGWDVKKSCVPVVTRLADVVRGVPGVAIRVYSEYFSASLSHLVLEWEVTLNGAVVQKGRVPTLTIAPQRSGVIRLPVKMPAGPGEVLLTVYYRLKKEQQGVLAGSLVAAGQFRLREYASDLSVRPAEDLVFTDEGGSFTITCAATDLNMQFNKQTGWLQHYTVGGRPLLEDSLGLITDLGKDLFHDLRLQLFSTSTSTNMVVVKADYMLSETAWLLHVRYTINAKGEMQVDQLLEADSTLLRDTTAGRPALKPPALFGMQWMLPAGFDCVLYDAPGQREGTADSCRLLYTGVYRRTLKEAGTVKDIRWWKAVDMQGHGLQITADSSFLLVGVLQGREKGLQIGVPLGGEKKERYYYIYKAGPL